MTYLLDTNTCIKYLNGRSANVARKINALRAKEAVVCSVVKGELFFGAMRSQNPDRTLAKQRRFLSMFRSLPFDDPAAREYGKIRAYLTNQGAIIGSNDLMIAAIAIANQLTLVTHNTREFSRVPNLRIEDWELD